MSLEKLLKTIEEKEDFLISQIVAETEQKISSISENFEREIKIYSEGEISKSEANVKAFHQREEVGVEIYKRKAILELKRQILNDVYGEFIAKVKSMDINLYKKWLLNKLEKIEVNKNKGEFFVGIGAFSGKVDSQFKADIENFIKSKFLNVNILFTDEIDFGLNYVCGPTIINVSLDSLISEIRKEKELELSKILFF